MNWLKSNRLNYCKLYNDYTFLSDYHIANNVNSKLREVLFDLLFLNIWYDLFDDQVYRIGGGGDQLGHFLNAISIPTSNQKVTMNIVYGIIIKGTKGRR